MNQFVLYRLKLLHYFCSLLVTVFEIMPLSLILDIGLYLNEKYL